MPAKEEKHVVITGVSSGIGFALATLLAKSGYKVYGSIRKQQDADNLVKELGPNFTPLLFDVRDERKIKEAAEKGELALQKCYEVTKADSLSSALQALFEGTASMFKCPKKVTAQQVREALKGHTLYALINNAGVAWPAPLLHQPISDFQNIVNTNLIGTVMVTQAFLPLLGTDLTLQGSPGRIINVTSVGGKYGPPFMSAYTASKHAIEGMSECLRRELIPYGISVVIFGPGSVRTPIWDKAQAADVSAYKDTIYRDPLSKFVNHMVYEGKTSTHDPEYMARAILDVLESSSPWTRYAVVSKRLMNWTLPLTLPARWVDKAMASTFGMTALLRK